MTSGPDVVCFRCGLPLGDPPRINLLPDGEPCGACAERLLETLPPIFHSPTPHVLEADREDQVQHAERDRQTELPDEPA